LNIHSVIHRCFLKARAAMVRVKAISLILLPMSLVGCITTQPGASVAPSAVVQPSADGFRTTTEGPVARSEPISVDLRDNLEGHSGFAMGRRVALIIGNSNYRGSISSLLNPANDARDVARSIESVGFDVDLLLDATRDEMNKAVLAFKDRLHDSDVGLFYYAGHAVQVNGRNFMMPVESDLQITDMRQDTLADYVSLETVEIDHVLGRMAAAEPDLNIVILDACRDNPFKGSTRGLSRGLAQTLAPRGTFIAYATAPGKVAEDGRGNNSPYTSALVEAVKIPGLKIEDVFKQVRRDVALQTDGRQTPWENSSIYGDFYFTPPAPTPPLTATLPEPLPAPAPEKAPVTATIPDILPTPENRTAPSESPARVQAQTPAPVDEDETTVRSKRPSINRFIITP